MSHFIPCVRLMLLSALLGGCQTPSAPANAPHPTASADRYGAASAIAVTRHAQYQLWQASAWDPNVMPGSIQQSINANSGRLSFDEDGDAVEFLAQLARLRGLQFAYSGVRLPLPLSLHVRDMTYENVLRLVRAQTAWRATLTEYPGVLHLAFMPIGKGAK